MSKFCDITITIAYRVNAKSKHFGNNEQVDIDLEVLYEELPQCQFAWTDEVVIKNIDTELIKGRNGLRHYVYDKIEHMSVYKDNVIENLEKLKSDPMFKSLVNTGRLMVDFEMHFNKKGFNNYIGENVNIKYKDWTMLYDTYDYTVQYHD